jgi:hypothetical protein
MAPPEVVSQLIVQEGKTLEEFQRLAADEHRHCHVIRFLVGANNGLPELVDFTIRGKLANGTVREWRGLSSEFLPDWPANKYLGACTSVANTPVWLIKQWIHYLLLNGVEHIAIYVNEAANTVFLGLRDVVAKYPVELIPWHLHDANDTAIDAAYERPLLQPEQQVAQNNCIRRYDRRVRWLLMSDIDEFVQARADAQRIVDFVRRFDTALNSARPPVCALKLQTWWFFAHNRSMRWFDVPTSSGDTWLRALDRAAYSSVEGFYEKCIVRGELVAFYSVHVVTASVSTGVTFDVDAHTEARLVHYKPHVIMHDMPRYGRRDVSMTRWAQPVWDRL